MKTAATLLALANEQGEIRKNNWDPKVKKRCTNRIAYLLSLKPLVEEYGAPELKAMKAKLKVQYDGMKARWDKDNPGKVDQEGNVTPPKLGAFHKETGAGKIKKQIANLNFILS